MGTNELLVDCDRAVDVLLIFFDVALENALEDGLLSCVQVLLLELQLFLFLAEFRYFLLVGGMHLVDLQESINLPFLLLDQN